MVGWLVGWVGLGWVGLCCVVLCCVVLCCVVLCCVVLCCVVLCCVVLCCVVLCCWEMVELESDGNQVWLILKCIEATIKNTVARGKGYMLAVQYGSCVVGFGSCSATNVHPPTVHKQIEEQTRRVFRNTQAVIS